MSKNNKLYRIYFDMDDNKGVFDKSFKNEKAVDVLFETLGDVIDTLCEQKEVIISNNIHTFRVINVHHSRTAKFNDSILKVIDEFKKSDEHAKVFSPTVKNVDDIISWLKHELILITSKNIGKSFKDVPEIMELLTTIRTLENRKGIFSKHDNNENK
jgi:hypothetical protein